MKKERETSAAPREVHGDAEEREAQHGEGGRSGSPAPHALTENVDRLSGAEQGHREQRTAAHGFGEEQPHSALLPERAEEQREGDGGEDRERHRDERKPHCQGVTGKARGGGEQDEAKDVRPHSAALPAQSVESRQEGVETAGGDLAKADQERVIHRRGEEVLSADPEGDGARGCAHPLFGGGFPRLSD